MSPNCFSCLFCSQKMPGLAYWVYRYGSPICVLLCLASLDFVVGAWVGLQDLNLHIGDYVTKNELLRCLVVGSIPSSIRSAGLYFYFTETTFSFRYNISSCVCFFLCSYLIWVAAKLSFLVAFLLRLTLYVPNGSLYIFRTFRECLAGCLLEWRGKGLTKFKFKFTTEIVRFSPSKHSVDYPPGCDIPSPYSIYGICFTSYLFIMTPLSRSSSCLLSVTFHVFFTASDLSLLLCGALPHFQDHFFPWCPPFSFNSLLLPLQESQFLILGFFKFYEIQRLQRPLVAISFIILGPLLSSVPQFPIPRLRCSDLISSHRMHDKNQLSTEDPLLNHFIEEIWTLIPCQASNYNHCPFCGRGIQTQKKILRIPNVEKTM